MLGDIDQNNHCFKLNALWMGELHVTIAASGPWFHESGHSSNLWGRHSAILLFCYLKNI